jgi:uncharacterized protein YeeX (DUF496 family)
MTANLYERRGKYHVMLSWYQGDARKQKSIATGISIEGNNKREAKAALKRIFDDWEGRIADNHKDILFSDYLKQWLEGHRHSIAETTYHSYKHTIENVICPYFAERKIKLDEIKHTHIQAFYKTKLDAASSVVWSRSPQYLGRYLFTHPSQSQEEAD